MCWGSGLESCLVRGIPTTGVGAWLWEQVANTARAELLCHAPGLLGVIFGVWKFQAYLAVAKLMVHTDHSILRWLLSMKEPDG